MIDFAPGMRTIIRDEEWMIKKIEINSLGREIAGIPFSFVPLHFFKISPT